MPSTPTRLTSIPAGRECTVIVHTPGVTFHAQQDGVAPISWPQVITTPTTWWCSAERAQHNESIHIRGFECATDTATTRVVQLTGAAPHVTITPDPNAFAHLPPIVEGLGAVTTIAASGAAQTIDIAAHGVADITLNANCAITAKGATYGEGATLTLIVRQDATGSRTVTWPTGTKWPNGNAPILSTTTTAGAVDLINLVTTDGGATWLGYLLGKAYA